MSSDNNERDWEALERIAQEHGTTPEALIQGTVDVFEDDVPKFRRDQAFLCICAARNCSRITGCENKYCAKHR